MILTPEIYFAQIEGKSKAYLVKMLPNTLAKMMSFPFQNNITFGMEPSVKAINVLIIKLMSLK